MKNKPLFSGDVVIAGGGMAGMTLALALHKAGVAVALVDALPVSTQLEDRFDGRASALAYTSWRLLQTLGVADHLDRHVQRIEDILVVDGRPEDGPRPGGPGSDQLHFDRREIHPDEDGEPLGWMAENRQTRRALAMAAKEEGVQIFAPERVTGMDRSGSHATLRLESEQTLQARLVVACDGRFSRLRQQAGIRTVGREYGQHGLVLTVEHERHHDGVAYEFFMPSGPFAILPLTGNRSSLVWTEKSGAAMALKDMDEGPFQEALEARFGDFLGEVKPASPRWTYPLGLKYAETFIDDRLALVGDAARAIHPIAGQGFNLGLRDVAALAECVTEAISTGHDPGTITALTPYERWRKTDSALLGIGTDFFNTLFSNDITPLRRIRGLGLGIVDQIPVARQFFMRQAGGETGDLPRLLRGESLTL